MDLVKYIDQMDNESQMIRAVDYFITHLLDDHAVPGEVWHTLTGIANWAREGKYVTERQWGYVTHNIEKYSDQIDLFK